MAKHFWHNPLPPWILDAPEYAELDGLGRHLLQTVANACDAPEAAGLPLLVCFAGDALSATAGVSTATLKRRLPELDAAGLAVVLSRGGGRLANVLGVPGERGQLDAYRAGTGERRGTGKAGLWLRGDSDRIRRAVIERRDAGALVGQRDPVTEPPLVGQRDPAPVSTRPGSRIKLTRQPYRDEPVPSSSPPNEPLPSTCMHGDAAGFASTDVDERQLRVEALRNIGITGPRVQALAELAIDAEAIVRVGAAANIIAKKNPAALAATLLADPRLDIDDVEWQAANRLGLRGDCSSMGKAIREGIKSGRIVGVAGHEIRDAGRLKFNSIGVHLDGKCILSSSDMKRCTWRAGEVVVGESESTRAWKPLPENDDDDGHSDLAECGPVTMEELRRRLGIVQ